MTNEEQRFRLAAKAGGKDLTWWVWNGICFDFHRTRNSIEHWNPRDDDGDSRRLEVDCVMDVSRTRRVVDVRALAQPHCIEIETSENSNGDPHAATRLAVLNCAVAIGEAMG